MKGMTQRTNPQEGQMFRKGDKVIGLGKGSTVWKSKPVGTVTKVLASSFYVQWDDCVVEDEMEPSDLLAVYWSKNLGRYVTVGS